MNWIRISALLVLATITVLSLLPPSSGVEIKVNDKFGHGLAYFVLMCNLGLLYRQRYFPWIALAILAYSCLMEYIQGFIPGRTVSWLDVVANTTGAIIGVVFLVFFQKQILALLGRWKIIR